METTNQLSLKTQLTGYQLWYDGDITVTVDRLVELLQRGVDTNKIYVDAITDEIVQFNKLTKNTITTKSSVNSLSKQWNIPQEYIEICIEEYVLNKLIKLCEITDYSDEEMKSRFARTNAELELYRKNNMFDVLRVIIYVINTLQQHDIVWGVGRGSSVSSYVLYLIGVHDVDSMEYGLEISDFMK